MNQENKGRMKKTKQNPDDHDVLFGRGNFAKLHVGNSRFRKLVSLHKSNWRAANRKERTRIATHIIHLITSTSTTSDGEVHPSGYFLKFNTQTRLWEEVTFAKALAKTQKTLREKNPSGQDEEVQREKRGLSGQERSSGVDKGEEEQTPLHACSPIVPKNNNKNEFNHRYSDGGVSNLSRHPIYSRDWAVVDNDIHFDPHGNNGKKHAHDATVTHENRVALHHDRDSAPCAMQYKVDCAHNATAGHDDHIVPHQDGHLPWALGRYTMQYKSDHDVNKNLPFYW